MAEVKRTVLGMMVIGQRRGGYVTNVNQFCMSARDIAIDLTAGSLGGAIGLVAGHPLDVIKVRLQSAGSPYTGLLDCVRGTIRNEGMRGLFKGLTPPLVGVAAYQAVVFASYRWCLDKLLEEGDGTSRRSPSDIDVVLAGMGSGLAATVVTVPTELVKIRLQVQTGHRDRYKGARDCVMQTVRAEGIRGLYRGTAVTLLRDMPATAVYFYAYEWTKRVLLHRYLPAPISHPQPISASDFDGKDSSSSSSSGGGTNSNAVNTGNSNTHDSSGGSGSGSGGSGSSEAQVRLAVELFAGGMAGVLGWGCCVPVDTIKTRIMSVDSPHTTILGCFRATVKEEGVGALFRGALPLVGRAFPVNAVTFAVYNWSRSQLLELA